MTIQQMIALMNWIGVGTAVGALILIPITFSYGLKYRPKELRKYIKKIKTPEKDILVPLRRTVEIIVPESVQEKLNEYFAEDVLKPGWHRSIQEDA